MERINVFENGIYMTLEITDKDQLKLLHFGAEPFDESKIKAKDYEMPLILPRYHSRALTVLMSATE